MEDISAKRTIVPIQCALAKPSTQSERSGARLSKGARSKLTKKVKVKHLRVKCKNKLISKLFGLFVHFPNIRENFDIILKILKIISYTNVYG